MLISGLQKLTLLDYPGAVACTVFTGGCNFRCPFCHNSSLVLPGRLSRAMEEEEFLAFLKKRRGMLEGVAVSGGEPLMQGDILSFLEKIKELGYKVKLDTNGAFPDRLEAVLSRGLADMVAMDIKNSPSLYGVTVGLKDFDISPVERSARLLMEGDLDYEFRTTLVKGLHTIYSVREMARFIGGAKKYYLQQYRDSGDIINGEGLMAFSEEEMIAFREVAAEFVPSVELRGV